MKLFRYGARGAERAGVVDADGAMRALDGDIDAAALSSNFADIRRVDVNSLPRVQPGSRIAPPVARIGKFVCIGLNYRDHALEASMPVPAEPIIFMKATSAIIGPNDDVLLPPTSQKSDWEVELGVIIGRECRYVPQSRALEHIAGVCVVNDVSEREYQIERGGTWDKGKGCDTFGPIGPYLVTLDEAGDLDNLDLWLDLNGKRMQSGNTRALVFNVAYLVHYVSQFMSLQPGDLISTGTPAGVGMGKKPPIWLKEGDLMTLGITGLGEQRLPVRRASAGP